MMCGVVGELWVWCGWVGCDVWRVLGYGVLLCVCVMGELDINVGSGWG